MLKQETKKERGPVSVCPVTGKLKKLDPSQNGKVRDGCVSFDEKYLHAAADAGLGSNSGM